MTAHSPSPVGALPIDLDAAIALLRASGYTVSAPKAPRRAPFRNDLMPAHRAAMRQWERARIEVTFADGETVFAYAMRDAASKPWFAGSALRAACDRYRYRQPRELSRRHATMGGRGCERFVGDVACGGYYDEIGPAMVPFYPAGIDHIPVPPIASVAGIPVDIEAANAATLNYRASDPSRPRKIFEGTAHL